MKILHEYTLDFLRRNRRSSLSVMVALLLTTTMLSTLCGFFWNMWTDNLRREMEYVGDWHGELFDETLGSMLPTIYEFPSVETAMIKGAWQAAKIDDPRREYLVYRDATAEYWASMPERFSITEGSVPQKSGELALSKQYFENHPELKIGDSITLPVGERTLDGVPLADPRELWQEGEQFTATGNKTYTIVAKLDVTTSSVLPAYTAIGFLDKSEIKPDDDVTVYLRFKNIRDSYTELPKLAQALGYQTDEYGKYLLKYNAGYLFKMLIFPPGNFVIDDMSSINMPLAFLICAALVVALFVMIIHNAFALSASSRLSQLGILASIGATPRQIKQSVIFEGIVLSAIPLPVGIALGALFDYGWVAMLNSLSNSTDIRDKMVYAFGLPAILPAVLLALITVWFSAGIPAKRVSRLTPIEAIRQGEGIRLKKAPKPLLGRFFGLEGELAAVSLAARKKSFRTATISLTLSVLVLTCILTMTTARSAAMAVYGHDAKAALRDIDLWINDGQLPDEAFLSELAAMDGVGSIMRCSDINTSMWLEPEEQSPEFVATGGLDRVIATNRFYPIEQEGRYRIRSYLYALDDKSFAEYCAALGIDPAPYYNTESPQSIVYNREEDTEHSTRKKPVYTEYLNLSVGDSLALDERAYNDSPAGSLFSVRVGHLADSLPAGGVSGGRYALEQIMPLSVFQSITEDFTASGRARATYSSTLIKCDDVTQVAAVRERLERIVDRYYGSGDYNIVDIDELAEKERISTNVQNVTIGFIVSLLAIIGLSSVWATIFATLRSRRRELAMLRSMGLSPRGLRRMLSLEAVLFSVTPLLLTIPVLAVVLYGFLRINEITLMEYLPFAPILPTLALMGTILAVVAAAYAIGLKRLGCENIVEAIKDETV